MSALRTISLRLRGTSVEVLEQMGEETEGVIESTSKLQEKIKALSGVDILSVDGGYRNPYEILKDIAEVYESIDPMDQAALIELVAGKNRANTLAAILTNFEDLEGAYESALNAEGSALKENEAYLDSIQGRIDLFNNAVQTMWMNFMDSEVVKFLVNVGTAAIKLADAIGLIPTGAGLFAGWKFAAKELEQAFGKTSVSTKELKKNINDYINQQRAAGQTATATAQEVVVAEQQKATAQVQATAAGKAEEVQDNKNIATDVAGAAADKVKTESQKQENQEQLNGVAAGKAEQKQDEKNIATDLTASATDVGAGNAEDIISTGTGVASVLGKIGTGIKAIGLALGKAALVMLAVKVATWAIGKAWEALDKNVINRAKHIREEVESLQKSYEDMKETLDSNLKTLTTSSDTSLYSTLEEEFRTLTHGVDQYGNNISLTSDQYERYKSICEDIVGINPKIARGYDSATQAIGQNASVLSELIELQKIQARQNVETLISDENFGKLVKDANNDYDTAINSDKIAYADANGKINEILQKKFRQDKQVYAKMNQYSYDFDYDGSENDDYIEHILSQLGYQDVSRIAQSYYNQTLGDYNVGAFISDYWNEIMNNTEKFGTEYQTTLDNTFTDVERAIRSAGEDVKEAQDGLIDDFLLVPQGEKAGAAYDKLNDASKKFITEWIKNSSQFKLDANETTEEAIANRDAIINMVQDLANDDYTLVYDGEQLTAQDFIDQIYNLDPDAVPWGEYKTKQQKLFETFWQMIGAEQNEWSVAEADLKLAFGLEFITDEKNTDGNQYQTRSQVAAIIGKQENDIQEWLDTLPVSKVHAFYSIDWNSVDNGRITNFEDIEAQINNVVVPDFNITDYTNSISALQGSISTYQSALEKLESGTFTMGDFVELIKEFPDLADGVDVSSKSFNGLSKNLKKAIKSSPDTLIDDLKDLKKQLLNAGKSTDAIDQLITSIENMPTDIVQSMTDKYSTLADTINEARVAQNKLAESMQENPNEGFETRGEAMEYMKEAMTRGEIGSESNLWNVAKQYGFTYDSVKSINENADALADFIAKREQWFATDDDGNYTYAGTEEFIQDVESAVKANEELAKILTWDYDENTGAFNVDFDNKNWDQIVSILSQTEELAGLTSEEFSDLMVQVGQYFGIEWGDYDDALDHLNGIKTGASDATTKLKEYGKTMHEYFGEDTKIDLTKRPVVGQKSMQEAGWTDFDDGYGTVYSSSYSNKDGTITLTTTPILPDGTVLSPTQLEKYTTDIINGADAATYEFEVNGKTYTGDDIVLAKHEGSDSIQQAKEYAEALHKAQEQYQELQDPLNLEVAVAKDGIEGLAEIKELQNSIKDGSRGYTIIDTTAFASVLKEAGYTEEQIDALIKKVQEYQGVITVTNTDPLGLNSQNASISTVMSSLDQLGIQYEITRGTLSNPGRIDISAPDLISTLQEKGWTNEQITSYLQTLTSTENGLGITVDGQVNMATDEVDAAIARANEIPAEKNVEINVTGNGLSVSAEIKDNIRNIPSSKTSNITIKETTYKKTMKYNPKTGEYEAVADGTANANGTAHVKGTANARGDWGVPKTETALVGELGPELLVRDGRWTTIGDNGAEFTQIKKGDIIFNHKQTEDLLSKGYVTGRGKIHGGLSAFASGTAYLKAGGFATSYTFDGNGGWSSSLAGTSSALSTAGSKISSAADEFKEAFDWIEVRLEELDEALGLLGAQLENAADATSKNKIIDDIIKGNKTKLQNLEAGYDEYAKYAAKLLTDIPKKYREAAQDGSIAITDFVGEADEKTIEAITTYREWAQKAADLKQQAEEVLTTIRDLAIEKFNNTYDSGSVKADIDDKKNAKLQSKIDYDEARGLTTSDAYYIAMMENTNNKISQLTKTRDAMQKDLDRAVEAGEIVKGSDEWYELVGQMYDIDAAIDEATIELEEFQNAINDIYWENFDNLIDRIDYMSSETQNLIDLMGNADMVVTPETEDGWSADQVEWTDEGLASLGLYAQQMEIAEYKARQYAIAIDDLTKDYNNGLYSESEYLEKLNELKDAQYDSIEAYYDAQDAIKDLNQARVDEIKNGIEKQVKAYEKLINKKKEALNAEKDLYDFQKSVNEQEKNIARIERQIAALSSDNSASARAKRAQLEAELAEAQAGLEESYYERSVSDQQDALDKELGSFQEEKEAEIQKWEEYLDNIEQVIAESLGIVKDNASGIYDTLGEKAQEYNLTLSDSIMTPWKDGALAVSDYQDTFDTAMSSTMDSLDRLKSSWREVIDLMAKAGETGVKDAEKENDKYTSASKKSTTSTTGIKMGAGSKTITVGGKVNAGDALIYKDSKGTGGSKQYYASDPIYIVLEEINGYLKVRHHSLSSGVTGWLKKTDVKAYAKGSKGVDEDQLALIDELGEELVLSAGQNGRLQYISKGTSIIPHDISENLMKLGKLDPSMILDQNRPSISAPHVVNNETVINIEYGDVLHIDNFSGDKPADLSKMIDKAFDKHMKQLNAEIRKYAR